MIGLKSNNFVFNSFGENLFALSQSLANFSLQLMTTDLTKGFLLPYNKISCVCEMMNNEFF